MLSLNLHITNNAPVTDQELGSQGGNTAPQGCKLEKLWSRCLGRQLGARALIIHMHRTVPSPADPAVSLPGIHTLHPEFIRKGTRFAKLCHSGRPGGSPGTGIVRGVYGSVFRSHGLSKMEPQRPGFGRWVSPQLTTPFPALPSWGWEVRLASLLSNQRRRRRARHGATPQQLQEAGPRGCCSPLAQRQLA